MSRLIPILSGRCLVVELPEGATNLQSLTVHQGSKSFPSLKYDRPDLVRGFIDLPPGNWRIIGMLSEVREEQAAGIVESDDQYGVTMYRNYKTTGMPYYDEQITALESLESAILAEGYVFENKLINPDDVCYFSRDRMIDDVREYHETQSRVLSRERALILRRVGL